MALSPRANYTDWATARQALTDLKFHKILLGGWGRLARKADLVVILSRLSRKYGRLNVLATYGPPRPVIGIAFQHLLMVI
jgi:hypothetical protein